MKVPLLIISASARWLAQSARRRGLHFISADYFGDWDTQQAGPNQVVVRLGDVSKIAKEVGAESILIGGGMENHWEALAETTTHCRILGFAPDHIQRIRDPNLWFQALHQAGLAVPRVVLPPERPPHGRWLQKPVRSGGGREITEWIFGQIPGAEVYLQQFAPGLDASAVYIGAAGKSYLLGVSWQSIGTEVSGTPAFQYSGSIGPIDMTPPVRNQLVAIGGIVAQQFGGIGLFGVDFKLEGETVWPVEVNPRPTASVELYERAGLGSIFDWHWSACLGLPVEPIAETTLNAVKRFTGVHGKRIVYWPGPGELIVGAEVFDRLLAGVQTGTLADIPSPATVLKQGDPLVTMFASGGDIETVRLALLANSQKLIADLLQMGAKPVTFKVQKSHATG